MGRVWMRFAYAVLAIMLGWMFGHRRGFDRGAAYTARLANMNAEPVRTAAGASVHGLRVDINENPSTRAGRMQLWDHQMRARNERH